VLAVGQPSSVSAKMLAAAPRLMIAFVPEPM
jgi:hypothetical protein